MWVLLKIQSIYIFVHSVLSSNIEIDSNKIWYSLIHSFRGVGIACQVYIKHSLCFILIFHNIFALLYYVYINVLKNYRLLIYLRVRRSNLSRVVRLRIENTFCHLSKRKDIIDVYIKQEGLCERRWGLCNQNVIQQ